MNNRKPFGCRSLNRWLLLFVTVLFSGLSFQVGYAAVNCAQVFGKSSFLAKQAIEGNTAAIKEAWGEQLIQKEPGFPFTERFFVGGERATRLQTVNGFMNGGIFFLEKSGTVYKLYQEGMFRFDEFIDTVRGNLMAMHVGGPAVLNFGELKSRDPIETASQGQENRIGERVFFIEFENIAEAGSFTLKDARKLKKSIPAGALESIAELTLKAVKQKIIPDDMDFMISPKGPARWIDGDSWYRIEQQSIFQYIQMLHFNLVLLPKSFNEIFLKKLQESTLFSAQEKVEIHHAWTKGTS